MKKSLGVLLAVAVIATPAIAQVRPGECAPVFPLMDQTAAAPVAQDVTVAQAGPAATAAKKGFFGFLPFLPLLLAAGGAAALSGGGGGGGGTVSPA